MNKLFLITILTPLLTFSQFENNINDLTINISCELKFTRSLDNLSNYSCDDYEVGNTTLNQYSLTVDDLSSSLNELNNTSRNEFISEYLNTYVQNMKSNYQEIIQSSVKLQNGKEVIKLKGYLTYSGEKFTFMTIIFVHKNNGYMLNLVTSELSNPPKIENSVILK